MSSSEQPVNSEQKQSGRKVTTRRLLEMKRQGERIAALTAYDFLMAGLLDEAGVDVILVGDSAGMVVQGVETTVSVTLEQMLYHAAVVSRGVERALVVADMPFMSYQVNPDEALRNAGRMVKESGVEAVKLEGGLRDLPDRAAHRRRRHPGHGAPGPDAAVDPQVRHLPGARHASPRRPTSCAATRARSRTPAPSRS